jgi:predicted house-cleaning noncanonical NTP pyrophosphatase (MazG superfamily)
MRETELQKEVVLTPIISKCGFSDYLVDCVNGRVYSKKSGKFLQGSPNHNGYVYNSLIDDNGKHHAYGVHRLVLASHTALPLEMFKRGGIEVDHINSIRSDNRLENLQMSSRKAQYKESTRKKMNRSKRRLSEEEVCEILTDLEEWLANGNKISDFIHMTAEAYGQGYRNVWNIVYGKSWKHLYEQFVSKFNLKKNDLTESIV